MCQYNIKYNFIIIIIIHFKTTVTTMVLYTQNIYIKKKNHMNGHVMRKTKLTNVFEDDLFPLFFFFKNTNLTLNSINI